MRLRDFFRATTFMSLTVITSLANTLPPALINRTEINRTECEVDHLRVSEPARSALPLAPEMISRIRCWNRFTTTRFRF